MRRNAFDPPELGEIREGAGVQVVNAFGMQVYLVTRHDDVKAMLSDHAHFANSRPPGFVLPGAPAMPEEEQASARAGNLLGLDPPEHQRLRRMLTPEFTIRRMKRLEPRIAEIVTEHLDAMEAAGAPVDLVESFALPIPSLVICELLGVPYGDRGDFQKRASRQLDLSLPIPERLEMQRQGREYMHSLVDRARGKPGEDILGMLIREHGVELSDDELVGIAGLLLLAGHETTSNMLGLGTLALLRHPEQLAAVRDDPDAIGPAVEELLRWLSIVQTSIPRITTADVEVAGVRSRPAISSSPPYRRAIAILCSSRRPTCWTSAAAPPGTSPSVTACTTASARRWPAWRCASHGPRCWPIPEPCARRGFRGCPVPLVPLHLRTTVAVG